MVSFLDLVAHAFLAILTVSSMWEATFTLRVGLVTAAEQLVQL